MIVLFSIAGVIASLTSLALFIGLALHWVPWCILVGWGGFMVCGSHDAKGAGITFIHGVYGTLVGFAITSVAQMIAPQVGELPAILIGNFLCVFVVVILSAMIKFLSQVPLMLMGLLSYFALSHGKANFEFVLLIAPPLFLGVAFGFLAHTIIGIIQKKAGIEQKS